MLWLQLHTGSGIGKGIQPHLLHITRTLQTYLYTMFKCYHALLTPGQ